MTLRPHNHRRFALFNNRRTGNTGPGREAVTAINRHIMITTQLREIRLATPFSGGLSGCMLLYGHLQAYFRLWARGDDPPVDNLQRDSLAQPLIETPVNLFKRADNGRNAAAIKLARWERHPDLMPLTNVANIRFTLMPNLLSRNPRRL